MPKILLSLAIFIFVFLAGLLGLVRYLEKNGVFFPSRNMDIDPREIQLPWEDIYFNTSDGIKLNGWFFKNPRAHSTVLFMHGNAGNMADRLLRVKFLYGLGLNVFIFDYRGYGRSSGRPSEKGIYLDGQAAYDYLKSRPDVDINRVIDYGGSLGGVVAVDVAVHRPVAALVVDSSITSARDMAKLLYPYVPRFFLNLKLDSLDKVKHLTIPKLFIHSPEDHVVPFWMGRRLFEAAAEPKEFLQTEGSHNDVTIATDPQAVKMFQQFLKDRNL